MDLEERNKEDFLKIFINKKNGPNLLICHK